MQLSNTKLVGRGVRMLMEALNISQPEAETLLDKHQHVRTAITAYNNENQ